MRQELKDFRILCNESNCDPKKAREFFRHCFNGKWDDETAVNNYICFAVGSDREMVKDAIVQNRN